MCIIENGQLNWVASFIWNIADDVLRDVYVRGKYRDVILPMTVIRRLDAVLEPTKKAVLDMKKKLDAAKIKNQEAALKQASGQAFYNTSPFTLRDLKARAKQQQLKADFETYLDGFSPNVQEILDKFKFRNQIPTLIENDILGHLIEKFLDASINLSPNPVLDQEGKVKLPGLDNHGMGTIFEELIRRFNEENNEEAGEHFTPRDVVKLMANLIFLPVASQIESGTYLVYDGACGTGGMLTVAEETLARLAKEHGKEVAIHLFGQEINPETYAISKADLLLKGEGDEAENFKHGSTLSQDGFPSREFDFMLSNPPYGKSWKTDLERMGGKGEITDPRFVVQHAGDPEFKLITRSNDGQLMFLVNMLSKMKHGTPLGSRIAEVHNGSSLFTGDAGQGESNIRRWIIENDWLEAIIALPLNMFYNTGIATYIWVLTNRKPKKRKGKVQLIDATQWFKPLRKNLGKKNCELSGDDIDRICKTFLAFKESDESKIFPNEAFGYWKITVERPLRLRVDLSDTARARFRKTCKEADEEPLGKLVDRIAKTLGPGPHADFNAFLAATLADAESHGVKLTAKRLKLLQSPLAEKDPSARPVIRKIHKPGKAELNPLYGRYGVEGDGKPGVVEYEPDPDLRDTSRCRSSKKAASRRSSAGRSCRMPRMPGLMSQPQGSATRFPSRGTSTSRSRCARWRRFALTSWRSKRKPRGCCKRLSLQDQRMTVYHEFDLLPAGHAARPRVGFCYTEHAMTWAERLRRHRDEILRLAAKHGAMNVRVFGSVARGEADEQSDLDLLVEFEPGRSLVDHAALWLDLQELLGGKVDVVTENGLYWLLKRRILKEARPL